MKKRFMLFVLPFNAGTRHGIVAKVKLNSLQTNDRTRSSIQRSERSHLLSCLLLLEGISAHQGIALLMQLK